MIINGDSDDDLDSFFINKQLSSNIKQTKPLNDSIDIIIPLNRHKANDNINNTMSINEQSLIHNSIINDTFQSNLKESTIIKHKEKNSIQPSYSEQNTLLIENIFLFNTKYNIPPTEPCFYINKNQHSKIQNYIPISSNEIKHLYQSRQLNNSTQFRPIDFYIFNHLPLYHFSPIDILISPSWINYVIPNPKASLFIRSPPSNCHNIKEQNNNKIDKESLSLFDQSIILPYNNNKDNDALSLFTQDFIEEDNKLINNKKKALETIEESGEWFCVGKKGQINLQAHNHRTKQINEFPKELKQELQNLPNVNIINREQKNYDNNKRLDKVKIEEFFAKEYYIKMASKACNTQPSTVPKSIKAFGSYYPI